MSLVPEGKRLEIPKPRLQKVPELTNSYKKAHKAYVLVSGLFASWELIGITLDTKGKWGVELKSPNGIPLILFTLTAYCSYKLAIEWAQCNPERQKVRAAKIDYWVAHAIALAAVAIAIIQFLARVKIADILVRYGPRPALAITFIGLTFIVYRIISGMLGGYSLRSLLQKIWVGDLRLIFLVNVVVLYMALVFLTLLLFSRNAPGIAYVSIGGIVAGGVLGFCFQKWRKSRSRIIIDGSDIPFATQE